MPQYPRMITGYYPCCPGCGARLEDYEIFACRIRGLKKPVCIGCLVNALVFVRNELLPMFDDLEQKVLELAEKAADRKVDCHVAP